MFAERFATGYHGRVQEQKSTLARCFLCINRFRYPARGRRAMCLARCRKHIVSVRTCQIEEYTMNELLTTEDVNLLNEQNAALRVENARLRAALVELGARLRDMDTDGTSLNVDIDNALAVVIDALAGEGDDA